jgi:uncharacterized UPF0160 family protein
MIVIATHDGEMHADEVFAVAAYIKTQSNLNYMILRTRDPGLLKGADLRIDVGGLHNPYSGDFDHHQDNSPVRANGIPYSSFGLIMAHYYELLLPDKAVFNRVDAGLVSSIDAADNGIATYDVVSPFRVFDIGWYVGTFNHIPEKLPEEYTPNLWMLNQFTKAVEWAGTVLDIEISRARSWLENREYLDQAIKAARGLFVINKDIPWVEAAIKTTALFAVFPDRLSGDWVVQVIPLSGRFTARKPLPSEWGGLRGQDLANITGVQDAIFCHKALFQTRARSKAGALELARLALEN